MISTPVTLAVPWIDGCDATAAELRERFDVSQIILGLWSGPEENGAGLVLGRQIDGDRFANWLRDDISNEQLVAEARRKGAAAANDHTMAIDGEVLVASVPSAEPGEHFWHLMLGRDQPWTNAELQASIAWLRLYRAAFDLPRQSGVARVFLDGHGLPLQVDATLALRATGDPDSLNASLRDIPAIFEQRYQQAIPEQIVSLTVPFPEAPAMLRMIPTDRPGGTEPNAFLEIRPADPNGPPAIGLVEDSRLAKSLAFLNDHYRENPSLQDLAAFAELSPFHLHRLFSREIGLSPKQYTLRLQIQHAKHLLLHSNQSIGEVASNSGFASHGHFTATFRRMTGEKPSDFRSSM